jgi:type VI protein secretion system component VasK
MSSEEKNQWLPVLVIAGALLAWGLLLAVGAYLAPGDAGAGRDFRKLWVVAAMTGAFLLLWGGVLWVRARKVRRRRQDQSDGSRE